MPKTRYTLLVEFDGDPPSVAAHQPILGGSLVGASFRDEFAEHEQLVSQFAVFHAGARQRDEERREAILRRELEGRELRNGMKALVKKLAAGGSAVEAWGIASAALNADRALRNYPPKNFPTPARPAPDPHP